MFINSNNAGYCLLLILIVTPFSRRLTDTETAVLCGVTTVYKFFYQFSECFFPQFFCPYNDFLAYINRISFTRTSVGCQCISTGLGTWQLRRLSVWEIRSSLRVVNTSAIIIYKIAKWSTEKWCNLEGGSWLEIHDNLGWHMKLSSWSCFTFLTLQVDILSLSHIVFSWKMKNYKPNPGRIFDNFGCEHSIFMQSCQNVISNVIPSKQIICKKICISSLRSVCTTALSKIHLLHSTYEYHTKWFWNIKLWY